MIGHIKKRFVEEGLHAELETRKRAPGTPVKFAGKVENSSGKALRKTAGDDRNLKSLLNRHCER